VKLARFSLLLVNLPNHPAVAAHFTPVDDSLWNTIGFIFL
jgi:hypothetical protein